MSEATLEFILTCGISIGVGIIIALCFVVYVLAGIRDVLRAKEGSGDE